MRNSPPKSIIYLPIYLFGEVYYNIVSAITYKIYVVAKENVMGKEIKQKLIESTIKEFSEKGLDLSFDNILHNSGVSLEDFNNNYPNFEKLLVESLEHGFIEIQKEKEKIIKSDMPNIQKLRTLLPAMPNRFANMNFSKLRSLEEDYPLVYETLKEHLRADWEPINELLNEAIIDEEIKPIDLHIFQTIYTSAVESFLYTDVLQEIHLSYDKALEQLTNILIDGINNQK